MVHTTTEETYRDGDVIFEEGSSGDWVYVVESGAVELSKTIDGRTVVLEVLRQGEVFGELAFVTGTRRTAMARSLGDTMVGILDRAWLDEEYNRLSGDFRLLIKSLALRLKRTTDAMVGLTNARQTARKAQELEVVMVWADQKVTATTLNISRAGMFIKTPVPLQEGDGFIARIPIPGKETPLDIRCTVAWVRNTTQDPAKEPKGIGAKFVRLTEEQKRLLSTIITK